MKKQEYKFTLGNGSEQEVRAESLSLMLANLPMAEKSKLQRRIVEERSRNKKIVKEEPVEPKTPPTAQTQQEAPDPKTELKAKSMEVLQKMQQDQIKIKELKEKLAKLKADYYTIE